MAETSEVAEILAGYQQIEQLSATPSTGKVRFYQQF
jgi:hypothetical protein